MGNNDIDEPEYPAEEGNNHAPPSGNNVISAKRTLIVLVGAGGIIVLVLIGILLGLRLRGENSQQPAPEPTGQGELLSNLAASVPGNNLAVTVTRHPAPEDSYTIDAIETTNTKQTIQYYRPREDSSYTIIKAFDDNDEVLIEEKFSLSTTAASEDFSLEDPSSQAPTVTIAASTAYLVLPLPERRSAARIQILNEAGQLLTEKIVGSNSSRQPADSARRGYADRLASFFTHQLFRIRPLQAQAPPPPPAGKFTIVIINEADFPIPDREGNLRNTATDPAITQLKASYVRAMFIPLEPWNTLKDNIEVKVIDDNTTPLGCTMIPEGFPQCFNDAAVIQAVQAKGIEDWDVIAVITPLPCNCGWVRAPDLPPIAAFGARSSPAAFAHEFGHATGKMGDEYLYKFGNTASHNFPNCFTSLDECRQTIGNFPKFDAECRPGCQSVNEWRPSTRIMHNSYQPFRYGPYETCLLGQKIAEGAGTQYNCNP